MKLDEPAPAGPPASLSPSVTLESALMASQPQQGGAESRVRARGRRRHGLRTGLMLMLAIGLIPALAGSAWHLRHLRDVAVRDAYAQADLIASGAEQSVRWLLQDAQAMMAAIAARPRVKALDPAECDSIFSDLRDISPAYKALSLWRLDGSPICSELQPPPSRQSVEAAPWFPAAVAHGAFYASDAHVEAVAQAWTARLTFPVSGPSGEMGGLLVTPVDLGQLQQRVFAQVPAHAVAAVVDGSNRILVRSRLQGVRVGQPAAQGVARFLDEWRLGQPVDGSTPPAVRQFTEIGIDGVRRLYVVRPVPLTAWAVVAGLPEGETLRGYYETRNRVLWAILAVLVMVALAAWRVSRGILVPIRGLASAARGVAAGDNERRAPESGPREITEVAREFNRMVVANGEAGERLRASESRYRALIQSLPVALVSHRTDTTIEVFNDRACALLRMTPEQMLGKAAADRAWFFVDADGQRIAPEAYPVSRVLRTRQPLPAEVLGIVSEGEGEGEGESARLVGQPGAEPAPHTWVMVQGYPQFDDRGELVRAIVVFSDVTVQRQAEQLRVAKEAAEAASKAKSVFLSRVSHELRTPLNAINGFSELMLIDEQVPLSVKDKVHHVLIAGRHLLALINQILDLTRIESGQIRASMQPVRLWPLLQECVDICGPLAQAQGIALVVNRPAEPGFDVEQVWVSGDDLPLRQVLINLLSNAIKYNRPLGQVGIDIEQAVAAEGGPDVIVKITDTGAGLRPAQIDALFQPFNRLGAEYTAIEGHGLGLSISRLLAQAMSGDITVNSTVGRGSCFAVHLRGCPRPMTPDISRPKVDSDADLRRSPE